MATRRPSVPKAQFTSGLSGAQEAAPVEAIPTNPKNLPTSGSGDRAATQKGAEKGAAKGSVSWPATPKAAVAKTAWFTPVATVLSRPVPSQADSW